MDIPCQKQALPLVHHNILAQSSLCQTVMAKCFLTHALHNSPFCIPQAYSFKNIHISFCGSHNGQLIAIGPEPWTNIAETPQLWVQLNEKNKQTWRGWREQLKQKQQNSNNLAYLGLPVTQFSFLPGRDMFWRAWVVLRDQGQADREEGGNSCCTAMAWKQKAKEHWRIDCRRPCCFLSQGRGQSVRVHGDAFMAETEIPHKKASLLANLLPLALSHCSLPYIWSD